MDQNYFPKPRPIYQTFPQWFPLGSTQFPTKTNIIEMYKPRKRYVPASMRRRFSNGCPNFDPGYYHYKPEIRHIPSNTEDDVQSQSSMNSSVGILSISIPSYCHRASTGK